MPAEPYSHRDKRQKVMDPPLSHSSAAEEVDYKKIDDDINGDSKIRRWRERFGDNLEILCAALLIIVVEKSAGRLHERYSIWHVAIELLQERPDLKLLLQTAWKSRSFRDIVDLDYLQRGASPAPPQSKPQHTDSERIQQDYLQRGVTPAQPSNPQSTVQEPWYIQEIRQALENSWQVPYQGTCHTVLFHNINVMFQTKPYLNVCAITQSSGTGKSRLVHEQANLVFTLPMNIRTSEGIMAAYPPPDKSLHKYLVEGFDEDECKTRYITFFACLFSHAAEELQRVFPDQRGLTQGEFASMWRAYMSDQTNRDNFYGQVVEMCNSDLANRRSLCSVSQAKKNFDALVGCLDARCVSTSRVKIMIYIDEAHELRTERWSKGKYFMKLDILCSVLANFYAEPLFCLLVSTQSLGDRLLASITETPFDCAPDLKISPGVLHVDDLSKIGYLAKWGRPLWWSWIDDRVPRYARERVERELVDFARVKLLCHHQISTSLAEVSRPAPLAVLDVLIGLDFEPIRTQSLQKEMVKSHMRIAYSVPRHDDREYFQSGYSSEPLLAEAAAQQMHEFQRHHPTPTDVMVDILSSDFNNTLIDLGQRDEVVMRLLLMRAYMDSVVEEHTLDARLNFSRGCKLTTFIKHLFSSKYASRILASKPNNLKLNVTFRAAFKDSVVRFTHFVKAGDSSAVTTGAAFAAFARGMAFICDPTQEWVDVVIPILLNKEDTLQESAMSAILIQVKRRSVEDDPQTYTFTQEDVGFFPGPKRDKSKHRPYIILTAELDTQLKGSRSPHIRIPPQPEVQQYAPSTHPCFSITAYGCSDTLYRVIKRKQNPIYQNLLVVREFLEEHGRQDDDSLDVVMKLKPYWECSENSYHWIDSFGGLTKNNG